MEEKDRKNSGARPAFENSRGRRTLTPSPRSEAVRIALLLLANLIYSFSMNLFIVPAGLYTGGILGLSQLLRSFLISHVPALAGAPDISGLIFYIVNVPFLVIASKLMGKLYFAKTILTITVQSLLLVVIPIPTAPIVTDPFAASIIGNMICGAMMGMILRQGACDGGMDLVGVLIVHQRNGASVGNANLYVNIVVFALMAFTHPIQTVIYSLVGTFVLSYALDNFFTQNISVEFHVIVRQDAHGLIDQIHHELRRSVTEWKGTATYSGEEANVLYIIVDKYEAPRLRRLIREYDPSAFVVENSGVKIGGWFEKHLT